MALLRLGCCNQASHRAATLENRDGLTGAVDVVQHGKTLRFELGCLEGTHMTRLGDHIVPCQSPRPAADHARPLSRSRDDGRSALCPASAEAGCPYSGSSHTSATRAGKRGWILYPCTR